MEALTTKVGAPEFVLTYDNKDITAAIAPWVTSVTYTDKLAGESDEIEVAMADPHARWIGPWWPSLGATLSLTIGYAGEPHLPCGLFTLDAPEFTAPPLSVTLKGLAAGVGGDARSKRDEAYQGQTLHEIASKVAKRHGYSVAGLSPGGLTHAHVRQNSETDLAFLSRLAATWGYHFSLKGKQLVFTLAETLDAANSVLVVHRSNMKGLSLKLATVGQYSAVEVTYLDARTGKTQHRTVEAPGQASGDTLKLQTKADSEAHAEALAKAALRKSQSQAVEGTLTLEGDRRLCAGSNLEIAGLGRLNGKYQIKESRHNLARSAGWTTEVTLSHVP